MRPSSLRASSIRFGRLVLLSPFFSRTFFDVDIFFSCSSSAVYLACGASFTRSRLLRPHKKTRNPIRSCLSALPLWEPLSTYQPILYLCRQKLICCINRYLSFCITTPQCLCTSVNSSQASHSLPRLTSYGTLAFPEEVGDKNLKKPKASSLGVNDDDAEPMTTSKGKGSSAMRPAASAL